ncbi:MAG: MBL fold metallo-hydrolase [Firmicutes bacterium]|nr:MBL fold metallo-hydrolase [Bacillota bacterium]
MNLLRPLDDTLYLFDLMEQGLPGRSSGYLLVGSKTLLVDTGSSPSHTRILAALDEIGIAPSALDYCILTHVHLDHAGGAGLLAQACPNTLFIAQERAARHLIDPSRLIAGARSVYGDTMEALFGAILPIPEDRVLIRRHGEQLQLPDRTLTFYDTPGHARHHFSIHDPARAAIFAGDAVGIRYVTEFTGWDFEFILPSTSPTDFDPDAVATTVSLLQTLGAETIYHTHFGPSPAAAALAATKEGARAFAELADALYDEEMTWEELAMSLQGFIGADLRRQGYTDPLDMDRLGIDVELDAKGLLYWQRMKRTLS